MSSKDSVKNLSAKEEEISSRIFDLALGRVLKTVYLGLDAEGKKEMEAVFLSDDDKRKEEFVKNNIPNFQKIFDAEIKKLEEEIKEEIKKQNQGK